MKRIEFRAKSRFYRRNTDERYASGRLRTLFRRLAVQS